MVIHICRFLFLACLQAVALVLLLAPAAPAAQTVEATVTRVVDGATVWAEDAHGTKLRIRLLGIDPPEIGHPRKGGGRTPGQQWADEARRLLADRIFQELVQVEVHGRDRYGRILGVIHQDQTTINLWLVRQGLAWVYRGGRNSAPAALRLRLEVAERAARRARRGLWGDPNPEPPWQFRRRNRLRR